MYSYIGKSALNDHMGSSTDMFFIQNHVIMNHVIKRLKCMMVVHSKITEGMAYNASSEKFHLSYEFVKFPLRHCQIIVRISSE